MDFFGNDGLFTCKVPAQAVFKSLKCSDVNESDLFNEPAQQTGLKESVRASLESITQLLIEPITVTEFRIEYSYARVLSQKY